MSKFSNSSRKVISFTIAIAATLALTACGQTEAELSPKPSPAATAKPLADPISGAVSGAVSGATVRVGILTIDSAMSVHERYSPLLDYLSEATGRPFVLVPLTQESQFTEVAGGKLDFTLNNPLAAVQIRRLYDTKFLATHSRPQTGPQFSGLIVVRSDSEIQALEDLRGKKGACVDFETAAAGCIFQIYHLQRRGIDPFADFGSFVENKSQDNIVLGILNGTIDVGFIRTGQLEKMVAKGLIDSLDAVRILEPAEDGFSYSHTTALYPEWPFAALKDADPDLAAKVEEALLNIPADHPALAAAKLEGFVPAVNYEKIDALIENLKLKSWDAKR